MNQPGLRDADAEGRVLTDGTGAASVLEGALSIGTARRHGRKYTAAPVLGMFGSLIRSR